MANPIQDYLDAKAAYENAVDLIQTETKSVVVLNFKALQLLRIKELQQELFDLQMRFTLGGIRSEDYSNQLRNLDNTLQSYGKALKNYDLLAQNTLSSVPPGSTLYGAPSHLIEVKRRSCKTPVSILAHASTLSSPTYELKNWGEYMLDPSAATGGNYLLNRSLQFRELDKDGREERVRRSAFSQRLSMALFGGVALIAPMLIMTLKPSQTTNLVTASVATAIFALVVAIFDKTANGKDVLGTTAAYAAVLVVFVGTSLAGPAPANAG